MSIRGDLAREIFLADNWRQAAPLTLQDWDALVLAQGANTYAHHIAGALLSAGYVKADHVEYGLDHKRAALQFTDDDGELWTDEDDVREYVEEYGDTAPLVKRHVTAWEQA